jgi:hypothetical protein
MVVLRKAAFLQKAWSKASPGEAWPSASFIVPAVGVLGKFPIKDLCLVPVEGLMEIGLRQRGGNGVLVVANPFYTTN